MTNPHTSNYQKTLKKKKLKIKTIKSTAEIIHKAPPEKNIEIKIYHTL